MKIKDVYEKHAARLLTAAEAGRPFAALTYGPDCSNSHYRTFANKNAADAFLNAAKKNSNGLDGVIAETSTARKGPVAFYIRPVTGFCSFP